MKKSTLLTFPSLLPLCLAMSSLIASAHAADYSPYPLPGVYEASDSKFERLLTIKANGKFLLEVEEKGKPGNLHTGAGEGQFSDAPGGWTYTEGRCTVSLKRAVAGMKLQAETCASAWGDVPFDGVYKKSSEPVAAMPAAKPAVPTAAAPAAQAMQAAKAATPTAAMPVPVAPQAGLPSRKELRQGWGTVSTGKAGGKLMAVMTKFTGREAQEMTESRPAAAAFIIDSNLYYNEMSPAELAKSPLKMVDIPLPPPVPKQGISLDGNCIFGKQNNLAVVNAVTLGKGNRIIEKPVSAWALDANMQAVEIKPANKVKCSKEDTGI
ncbi:hypothetical protein ACO0LC_16635 [Undibacterium sp. JH2W]|uniref:hypothetical protein n=1 Tax=Undibacterium sp. JH2W TaxID=3413037 RepID=UPI003BF42DB5